ncbi:MAG: O-antigen ligase domain-containing protein, partial [Paraglaciecola sp.]
MAFRVFPIFAFVLYEAVYFFNPESRWWGKMVPDISYSFFISITLILFLFTNFEKIKANRLFAVPQFRWAFFILFLYCIAYTYAAIPVLHYNAMVNMIKLFIVISIAYKLCDTDKKFDYVLWGYVLGAWY